MALAKELEYTIHDIEALPAGERAELVDGRMYYLAAPLRVHQKIVTRLAGLIDRYITSSGGDCEVYAAPFAVHINGADDIYNYVEPDISVICDNDKLTDKGCTGAPDWIIEVVSPSTKRMDFIIKMEMYRKAGVREYWIISPESETVAVFGFEGDSSGTYRFADAVPAGIYPGFSVRLCELG